MAITRTRRNARPARAGSVRTTVIPANANPLVQQVLANASDTQAESAATSSPFRANVRILAISGYPNRPNTVKVTGEFRTASRQWVQSFDVSGRALDDVGPSLVRNRTVNLAFRRKTYAGGASFTDCVGLALSGEALRQRLAG